jgi:hypothetical protein
MTVEILALNVVMTVSFYPANEIGSQQENSHRSKTQQTVNNDLYTPGHLEVFYDEDW